MINIRGELKTGVLLHVANKYKMFPKKFNNLPDCCKFSLIQEYADTLGIYITTYPIDIFDGECHGWGFMIEQYEEKDIFNDRLDSRPEAQLAAIEKLNEIINHD